jgi:RNA polymerase sigma-70 factor (ECF subfamily)
MANISRRLSDGNVDVETIAAERDQVAGLVRSAQAGDRDAFGELYRMYVPRVFRLARFSLGTGAEDAVSETFTRAWTALPRYRDTGAPFVAWLYGIARHVVTDQLRTRGRSEPRETVPDRMVHEEHDDRLDLAAAMAELPEEQRRVIEMKFLMGLTNPEVARVLGKSIGAVNAQQWRALRALKGVLEAE